VDSVSGQQHHVDAGHIADVTEIITVSIFTLKISETLAIQPLLTLCHQPET
jgi:hypothetical protein